MNLHRPPEELLDVAGRVDDAQSAVSDQSLADLPGVISGALSGAHSGGAMSTFASTFDEALLTYSSTLASISQAATTTHREFDATDASNEAALGSVTTDSGYSYPGSGN